MMLDCDGVYRLQSLERCCKPPTKFSTSVSGMEGLSRFMCIVYRDQLKMLLMGRVLRSWFCKRKLVMPSLLYHPKRGFPFLTLNILVSCDMHSSGRTL
jgi:hypothetical protein